jgi:hypothetical protein
MPTLRYGIRSSPQVLSTHSQAGVPRVYQQMWRGAHVDAQANYTYVLIPGGNLAYQGLEVSGHVGPVTIRCIYSWCALMQLTALLLCSLR